jgi:hypothetical protein
VVLGEGEILEADPPRRLVQTMVALLTTPGSLRYSQAPPPSGPVGAKAQELIDRLPEAPRV